MKINKLQIIIIAIFIITGIYVLAITSIKKEYTPNYDLKDYYVLPAKKQINEYTVVNVSEEDMTKTYFNTFIQSIYENTNESYDLLNKEYKEKKYPTYDKYLDYVKRITNNYTELPKINKYTIKPYNKEKLYITKDNNNNLYIFRVDGVMKYTVYLDNDTIKLYD